MTTTLEWLCERLKSSEETVTTLSGRIAFMANTLLKLAALVGLDPAKATIDEIVAKVEERLATPPAPTAA
jgi:hypothetical protein